MLILNTGSDPTVYAELESQIAAWQNDPFNPYVIARLRTTAFQKTVVMHYIDTLIAWGDRLFRQDSIESINEATELYVLASQILGDRPDEIPPAEEIESKSFVELQATGLDAFSNALVEIENVIPTASEGTDESVSEAQPTLDVLYFGIPPNDKLLGYWDTVADRLFKIRHCMNIEGVVRTLPLFEPPIDPALLVAASAAGVDLSSALTDLSAPLPQYRFSVMVQKAEALAGTVRSLGAALQGALERRDAEDLEALRAGHEVRVLESMKEAKEHAVKEAEATVAGLEQSQKAIEARRDYYAGLIDEGWIWEEQTQFGLLVAQQVALVVAGVAHGAAAIGATAPNGTAGTSGVTGSPVLTVTWGGGNVNTAATGIANVSEVAATALGGAAQALATTASYKRRAQEWTQQLAVAKKDLASIEKQVAAANIRVAIAKRDLSTHERMFLVLADPSVYDNAKGLTLSVSSGGTELGSATFNSDENLFGGQPTASLDVSAATGDFMLTAKAADMTGLPAALVGSAANRLSSDAFQNLYIVVSYTVDTTSA